MESLNCQRPRPRQYILTMDRTMGAAYAWGDVVQDVGRPMRNVEVQTPGVRALTDRNHTALMDRNHT
jgi:hypothetical protein